MRIGQRNSIFGLPAMTIEKTTDALHHLQTALTSGVSSYENELKQQFELMTIPIVIAQSSSRSFLDSS